jgi:hypothetical protein
LKATIIRVCFAHWVFLLITQTCFAQAQGKVVVNEYMPWTGTSCGTTAEFVELQNYGPGPVDISCYILTTGIYSITIPKNTVLQPGDYYILAGQSFLPNNCANVDSAGVGVSVDLDWNSCNCTNLPIPTTGNGLMTDGGSGNTPLVLLDPALNIIDAVSRQTPSEPINTITSATTADGCVGKTFNIATMNPTYEVLGMAPGRANSFSRALDGDCNWMKDPQQSGNASNSRGDRTTDISYEFDMVNPTSCNDNPSGSVSIYVKHSNYASIFPMTYTIALDSDKDGRFEFEDQYTSVMDNEPPFIEIDNLPVGHFRVTVASSKGCYLRSFDFNIINCNPGVLPVRLVYFKNKGTHNQYQELEWMLQDVQNLQSIVLEKSGDRNTYEPVKIFANETARGSKLYSYTFPTASSPIYFRLKITQKDGQTFYSSVVNPFSGNKAANNRISPNPARDKINLQLFSEDKGRVAYIIYNINGLAVARGNFTLIAGSNNLYLPVQFLSAGTYQLQVTGLSPKEQPISFRFVKQ